MQKRTWNIDEARDTQLLRKYKNSLFHDISNGLRTFEKRMMLNVIASIEEFNDKLVWDIVLIKRSENVINIPYGNDDWRNFTSNSTQKYARHPALSNGYYETE